MNEHTPIETVRAFVDAFATADVDGMGRLLDDAFVGHVTSSDGGSRVTDRRGYLDSVLAMDVPSAHLRLEIPNVVEVEPGRVLVMVEVHAARNGRTLHNFSGQLVTVEHGTIRELWMVEALPAESDEFWSA